MRGIRTVRKGIKEELREIVKKQLGIDLYIKTIKAIGGGLVVELFVMENKIELIKRKGLLRGMNFWIEDDLTERERQVQEWLESLVEDEVVETPSRLITELETYFIKFSNKRRMPPIPRSRKPQLTNPVKLSKPELHEKRLSLGRWHLQ